MNHVVVSKDGAKTKIGCDKARSRAGCILFDRRSPNRRGLQGGGRRVVNVTFAEDG